MPHCISDVTECVVHAPLGHPYNNLLYFCHLVYVDGLYLPCPLSERGISLRYGWVHILLLGASHFESSLIYFQDICEVVAVQ